MRRSAGRWRRCTCNNDSQRDRPEPTPTGAEWRRHAPEDVLAALPHPPPAGRQRNPQRKLSNQPSDRFLPCTWLASPRRFTRQLLHTDQSPRLAQQFGPRQRRRHPCRVLRPQHGVPGPREVASQPQIKLSQSVVHLQAKGCRCPRSLPTMVPPLRAQLAVRALPTGVTRALLTGRTLRP